MSARLSKRLERFLEQKTLTGEVLPERVHWLIQMRWIAVAGMLVVTVLARWALGIRFAAGQIAALAALVAAYNLVVLLWLRRRERLAEAHQASRRTLRRLVNLQIALDLLVLVLVLHCSGGVTNPLAIFMVFHMAIASTLLPPVDAYVQAAWAALLYAGIAVAEMAAPGLHRAMLGYPADTPALFQSPLYVAAQCGALLVSLVLIVYFTSTISQRLRGAYLHLSAAYDQLEQLEHTKSRFLRVASHQLRGPLAAIHSLLSALEPETSEWKEPQRRLIGRVQERAEVMMDLLDEMLKLSAMKESRIETENRQPVAVDEVLLAVGALHEESARQKKLELRLDAGSEAKVLAWDGALDDVIGNLLLNAIKYTPPGGKVEATTRRAGRFVVLTVNDTGIGIPPGDQERLFAEFYRAGNAKKFCGGTGLGLSIVKEVLDRLGGRIMLSSMENQGTTVHVELPMC